MIVNKYTKSINVFKVLLISIPSIWDVSHRSAIHENILNGIVHRIVKESGNIFLIVANISIISVEGFSHLENTSRLAVLSPEIFWDFRNSINTNTVKAILLDKVFDPVF